jgi:tetratricopeptide (TPR) repeat protein
VKGGADGEEELLERYEAYGDESLYAAAKQHYEHAAAEGGDDAQVLVGYGYLQECHGRNSIRAAADCYQRAIDADPDWVKPHLQLIAALTALGELDTVIPRYQAGVADASDDPCAYRLLSLAYLAAHDYDQAAPVIRAGLQIAANDAALVEQQGDLYAATGRPEEALSWWQRAFTLASEDYGISMRYSAAYLLERQGRLDEALREWQFIISWCEQHGAGIAADWPKRELQRLQATLNTAEGTGWPA